MAARVLVAGASGYIGSHVVAELLRQGYQVVALLRPDSDWHLEHPDLELVRAELTGSGVWFADLKACSLVVSCLASRTGGPCLLYTSPSPRDKRQSRMPSSA